MAVSVQNVGKQAQRWLELIARLSHRIPERVLDILPAGLRARVDEAKPNSEAKNLEGRSGKLTQAQQLERLKKAYARMQKSSTANAHRLQQLESLLTSDESRDKVLLYFQLKSMWRCCHQLMASHQKQLIREYEGKERDKMLGGYKEQQEKESATLLRRLERLENERKIMEEQKRELIQQLNASKQPWHILTRRQLNSQLGELNEELEPIVAELRKARGDQDGLLSTELPKLKGMSVATRRAINIHLIAYAQFYYTYLAAAGDISRMVKAAQKQQSFEANYGSADKCRKMCLMLEERKKRLKAIKGLRRLAGRQVKKLASKAQYRSNKHTVPEVFSMGFVLSMDNFSEKPTAPSEKNAGMVNVVQDNYWDITKLLIS